MTLRELQELALELHRRANCSTGISPADDVNEWMAEKIDSIVEEGGYELQDVLAERDTTTDVILYLEELYEQARKSRVFSR